MKIYLKFKGGEFKASIKTRALSTLLTALIILLPVIHYGHDAILRSI